MRIVAMLLVSGIALAAEVAVTPATLLPSVAQAQPGDTLVLAPGRYHCPAGLTLAVDQVTLRGPAGDAPAVIDGDVDDALLRNRDEHGQLRQADNGMRYDPIIRVQGRGVTVERVEVCHGHVGIRCQGANATVRECHVHHVSQHAIELCADDGLAEGNVVHDAILYNADGQCLVDDVRDGIRNQNRRHPIVDATGHPTKRHMDWGQAIQFHGKYRGAAIPHGGMIRGNIVWDVWGEGVAAYHATHVTIIGNITLNAWRMAYYLQNVDEARLEGNIALFDAAYRERTKGGALQAGVSIANEYEVDELRRHGDATAPLVPDGRHLAVVGNAVFGAWYGIHSGDRSLMNRDGLGRTRIERNVVVMASPQPCLTLNASLRGPVSCAGNSWWRSDGGPLTDIRAPDFCQEAADGVLTMTPEAYTQLQRAVAAWWDVTRRAPEGNPAPLMAPAVAAVRAAFAQIGHSPSAP